MSTLPSLDTFSAVRNKMASRRLFQISRGILGLRTASLVQPQFARAFCSGKVSFIAPTKGFPKIFFLFLDYFLNSSSFTRGKRTFQYKLTNFHNILVCKHSNVLNTNSSFPLFSSPKEIRAHNNRSARREKKRRVHPVKQT